MGRFRKTQTSIDEGSTPHLLKLSNQGGPVRTILNGRRTNPTGTFIAVKAGYRSLPWESKSAELPTMRICEISPRVCWMMSQHNEATIHPSHYPKSLKYTPDLVLDVIPSLISDLDQGIPFGEAALSARFEDILRCKTRRLVLEIKSENDPRLDDEIYGEKLRLAADFYRLLGYEFRIVHQRRDIECVDMAAVNRIVLDNTTVVTASDVAAASIHLSQRHGVSQYHSLSTALGGGPLGDAKVHVLAIKRVVCFDFSTRFNRCSAVHLVRS